MKLVQQQPGGENIKAFTRIMHRTTDDDLVGEVRQGYRGTDRTRSLLGWGLDRPA
jgi:hypothetical protein